MPASVYTRGVESVYTRVIESVYTRVIELVEGGEVVCLTEAVED